MKAAGREVEMEFMSVGIELKNGGQTAMKFDSKDPVTESSANPFAAVFKKLAGARVKPSAGCVRQGGNRVGR